ncbi:MAG: glycosyl transferase [Pseudomonadota bacterium]
MVDDGIDVTGFMMHRRETELDFKNIDLGQTYDGRFFQRLRQIWIGAVVANRHSDELLNQDVIYARNLDMLLCAFLAKRFVGSQTSVVYESSDIHRLLSRHDWVGKTMRWVERTLLRRCRGVVVSSPAFIEQHFERYYPGLHNAVLIENRWLEGAFPEPRPSSRNVWTPQDAENRPLNIGWVGMLRCQRSLDLMCKLAKKFPNELSIKLHGIPALVEVPRFEEQIAAHDNILYAGPYSAPEDLAEIYEKLDLVWAGDFMEAGSNSEWLLPNRIYEGGYYAVPSIAPIGTETEKWLRDRSCGFGVDANVEDSLPTFIEQVLRGIIDIKPTSDRLLLLGDNHFVQPRGFFKDSLETILN